MVVDWIIHVVWMSVNIQLPSIWMVIGFDDELDYETEMNGAILKHW